MCVSPILLCSTTITLLITFPFPPFICPRIRLPLLTPSSVPIAYSVHGGPQKEPIVITKDHEEGLTEMDKLSAFAPLHVSQFHQPLVFTCQTFAFDLTHLFANPSPLTFSFSTPRPAHLSHTSLRPSHPFPPPLFHKHRITPPSSQFDRVSQHYQTILQFSHSTPCFIRLYRKRFGDMQYLK